MQVSDNIRSSRKGPQEAVVVHLTEMSEANNGALEEAAEEVVGLGGPSVVTEQERTLFEANCILYQLTPREKEVVLLLRQGLTYRQIADTLFIAKKTVANHVTNIYVKTGTNTKFALFNKMGL
jgi:DNA-binding CsgD family transcriptional regulator